MGEYWLVCVDRWDPSMNEDEETYYAEIKATTKKGGKFKVQDLEEAAEVEDDVELGRSNMQMF